jgi:hypothetical protein
MIDPALNPWLNVNDAITDNLVLLLIVLFISITLIAIIIVIDQWSRLSSRTKLDELETKVQKLKRYAQDQKRKALRDSIAMLKPGEREHLYSIWEDNAVVSRKAIFRLNELEDRLRRSERGAELRWAEARINEIKDTERRLFPESGMPAGKKGRR